MLSSKKLFIASIICCVSLTCFVAHTLAQVPPANQEYDPVTYFTGSATPAIGVRDCTCPTCPPLNEALVIDEVTNQSFGTYQDACTFWVCPPPNDGGGGDGGGGGGSGDPDPSWGVPLP